MRLVLSYGDHRSPQFRKLAFDSAATQDSAVVLVARFVDAPIDATTLDLAATTALPVLQICGRSNPDGTVRWDQGMVERVLERLGNLPADTSILLCFEPALFDRVIHAPWVERLIRLCSPTHPTTTTA